MSSAQPSKKCMAVRSREGQRSYTSREVSPPLHRFVSSLKSIVSGALRGITGLLRRVPSSVRWTLVLLIIAAWALNSFRIALDLPTVYVSTETNQCVRVENAKGKQFPCDPLPKKYRTVYVY